MSTRTPSGVRVRRGIALLAVLSAIIAIAALGAATRTQITLDNLRLDRNRLRIRARWTAEGCANAALAEVETALRPLSLTDARRVAIDSIVMPRLSARTSGCTMVLHPLGTGLTAADRASEARLANFLMFTLGASPQTDSLAAALLDWEDADKIARPLGAELAWYNSLVKLVPRNAPIVTEAELALVRGFESGAVRLKLRGLIGEESTSICAKRMALPVLASRLGTSLAIADQIRRADDAGIAFERRYAMTLSATDGTTGHVAQSVAPSFACDMWRLEAATAVGLESDSVRFSATIAMLGSRAALLGVEVDQ